MDYMDNKPVKGHSRKFSGFLLHASEMEKRAIFTEAAHKANEEQMQLFRKSRLVETA